MVPSSSSSQAQKKEHAASQMQNERRTLAQLLEAANNGDLSTIQKVALEYKHNHNNTTALSITEIVSQFKDAQKRTIMHFACQSSPKKEDNTVDIVDGILHWLPAEAVPILLRCKDSQGLTPLMIAVQCTDHAVAEQRTLAILKADQLAASSSNTSTTLSKLGLNRSKSGATALHYAAANGVTATTIEALYNAGRVALSTFSQRGGTPLHWACSIPPPTNYTNTIQTLLNLGADINATNDSIPPPLILAIAAGNTVHTKCLLQYTAPQVSQDGADATMTTSTPTTPASSSLLRTSLHYILQPGNVTVYHMAADMNQPEILSLLLDHLATITNEVTATTMTTTALANADASEATTAAHNSYADILEVRNCPENLTALDLAAKQEHVGCVVLLLNAMRQKDNNTVVLTEDDAREYIQTWKARQSVTTAISTQMDDDNNLAALPSSSSSMENDDMSAKISATTSDKDEDPVEAAAKKEAEAIQQRYNSNGSSDVIDDESKKRALEHKDKGNTLYSQKLWDGAISEYTAAIQCDPLDATYYSNRSACYLAMENKEMALHDAIMARYLHPTWPKAAYRLAVARLALCRYEDAAVAAWEGIQLDADNDELKSLLQKCVKLGRKDYQHNNNNNNNKASK